MNIKLKAKVFYFLVLILLIVTTLSALYNGGYHIQGGAIAGIALASIVLSLVPFFISMHLFNKYEQRSNEKEHLKTWDLLVYFFCFPVKIWIIYLNLALIIFGGDNWSFG